MKRLSISLEGKHLLDVQSGQAIKIGRATENDLVLNSQKVSRLHTTLTVTDSQILLTDTGSTHGTFVDGVKIQAMTLANSCSVQLGDQILKFDVVLSPSEEVTNPNIQSVRTLPINKPPTSHPINAQSAQAPLSTKVLNRQGERLSNEINGGLSGAFNLVMKTFPYVLFRFGVYSAATVIAIVWYGLFFSFFGLMASGHSVGAFLGFVILCLPFGIAAFMFRYSLYLLKAGHIAVLTELIHNRPVPKEGMVVYGKDMVTKNLGQISILFVVDGLIKGVVGVFNRTLDWISSWIPIPGLHSVVGVIQAVIRMATTYIDECILSYNLTRKNQNIWESSCDGLVLYAQNSKEILKTAVFAVVTDWVMTGVLYVVMLAPAGLFVYLSPKLGAISFLIALFLAFNIRAAFVRPLLLTYIMMNYHRLRQGQAPDPVWQAKLHDMSGKFRDLEKKAKDFMPRPASPANQTENSA
jgi:hypothetical protein